MDLWVIIVIQILMKQCSKTEYFLLISFKSIITITFVDFSKLLTEQHYIITFQSKQGVLICHFFQLLEYIYIYFLLYFVSFLVDN